MRLTRTTITLAAVALAGVLAGGGALAANLSGDEPVSSPDAGRCAPDVTDVTDCDDTPDDYGADFDRDAAIEEAKTLLDLPEGELDPSVRVSRRGDEEYFLTEDHVLGRVTVTLDADADGTYRVSSITVETPDGSERWSVGG